MSKVYIAETVEKVGSRVELKGWVERWRDLGKIVFIDLRDSTGVVQVVVEHETPQLRVEDVVAVTGTVQERKKKSADKKTLSVEIVCEQLALIDSAENPPLPLVNDGYDIDVAQRLKYRYLDLRRRRLQRNIQFRDRLSRAFRAFLHQQEFTEIETPLLTKSTPEGSRDFVVPSRLHPGKFYALPQSPQQYKQLLMVAGFERYFQIARCLRDEDLRSDRGFEHTQVDLEMSFVSREAVMQLVEEMTIYVIEEMGFTLKEKPFPVFTHEEVSHKYGSDTFDLRSEKEKKEEVMAFAWVIDYPFFEKTSEGKWTFSHNPFSDPLPEHKERFLKGDVEGVLTTQYDLVCNGFEVGGGSIRSSKPEVLRRVFEVLGYSQKSIDTSFGHLMEAFKYGVPPHGGIALGLERLLMILLGEDSLSEVVAFPMSYRGNTAVMEAPAPLDTEQLKELGIHIENYD